RARPTAVPCCCPLDMMLFPLFLPQRPMRADGDTLAMSISRENGLDIYYETAGAGPPLVLIHALPFDHNLWLYQVERFSARFRTLAMDLRGCGRSAKPRTAFSLVNMGEDIFKLMTEQEMRDGAIVL